MEPSRVKSGQGPRSAVLVVLAVFLAAALPWRAAWGWGYGGVDESSYESEDFEMQEEGMVFDHSNTGLMFKRNLYIDGDNVTHVPGYPTSYNDTRDQLPGKVYISHWEQDPPSFITVYFYRDTDKLTSKHEIDFEVSIGHYDRAKNLVVANRKLVTGIVLEDRITRVPVNIHNYKGDIVSVKMKGERYKFPILPIEPRGD